LGEGGKLTAVRVAAELAVSARTKMDLAVHIHNVDIRKKIEFYP